MSLPEYQKKYRLWDMIRQYFTISRDAMIQFENSPVNTGMAFDASFLRTLVDYLNGLYVAEESGTPVAMYNFCVPPELFYAGGVYPLCQEVGSIALALANSTIHLEYIDIAEESGLQREQCNAQKIWIGAMIKDDVPKPDFIVYASQPCDSTNILYQVMSNFYDVPTFTYDIPYYHYEESHQFYDERVTPYCADQVRDIVKFIEVHGKTEITLEKLKETITYSNEARNYALETMELLKHKPNPLPSLTPVIIYLTLMVASGLPSATKYTKWCRDTAKERIKEGLGYIENSYRKKEEKYRCFWVYIPVFFDPMLFQWMEQKFEVTTVLDMLGYQQMQPVDLSSEQKMYEGLAHAIMEMPMARQSRGPMEYYLDDVVTIVKDYDIDFCIWAGHIGCKHSFAIAALMRRLIEERTGVPTMIFELDSMDSRNVNSKTIKKKITDFMNDIIL